MKRLIETDITFDDGKELVDTTAFLSSSDESTLKIATFANGKGCEIPIEALFEFLIVNKIKPPKEYESFVISKASLVSLERQELKLAKDPYSEHPHFGKIKFVEGGEIKTNDRLC